MGVINSQRGSATLELALLTPFMMVIFYVIVQIGSLFAAQQTVTYAAREAARYAATTGDVATAINYGNYILKESNYPESVTVSGHGWGQKIIARASYTQQMNVLIFSIPKTVTGQAVMRGEK